MLTSPVATSRCLEGTSRRAPGAARLLLGKEDVSLLGLPSTGKAHLAIGIGIRACLAGHRGARLGVLTPNLINKRYRHPTGDAAALKRSPLVRSYANRPEPAHPACSRNCQGRARRG